jgi:uncharacterized membrane protein
MNAPTPITAADSVADPELTPAPDPKLDLAHVTRTEFINAMSHLYRGELGEATAWRTRIDATSNWAIVLSATALSFVFADTSSSARHVLIPIITLFVSFMLFMEARRYRFYDIWRTRARMMEIHFFRPMLDPSAEAKADWAAMLAQDLQWPHFHMPWYEAAGRRLRRNYQWIYAILLGSWLVVLLSHPTPTTSPEEIAERAAVGPIPGPLVIAGMCLFYGALLALGVFSLWKSRYTHALPAGHPERLRAERQRAERQEAKRRQAER